MQITDWLSRTAEHHPDRIALESLETGKTVDYATLHRRVDRLAGSLTNRLRLVRGSRVAVLAQNRFAHIELLFACARAGLIFVPLNWRLAPTELAAILRDCAPSLLLAESTRAAPDIAEPGGFEGPRLDLDAPGDYEALFDDDDAGISADLPAHGADAAWMLLYTSGTTGQPKGVVQTFGMVYVNAVNTFLSGKVLPGDNFLNTLPFFHTGGLNLYTLPVLMSGGTVVLTRHFDAAAVLDRLTRDIDAIFAVPAIYLAIAGHERFAGARFPRLRNVSVGGAPIPGAIADAFATKGVVVAPSYGMTEAGPTLFAADIGTARRKPLGVGKPVGATLVRLVDARGQALTGARRGRLQVAGPTVTPGYWNREDATRSAIVNGWLDTGDIAQRDADGDYFIVDRSKDMFISGGENVYPAEIENVLYAEPAIAEAAVIGVADPRWGEVGLALIVPVAGAAVSPEDVKLACRRRLAGYKVPAHVRVVTTLPRTASGKIEKHKLREQFAADYLPGRPD